ncbi:MAG: ATP-binding protein [Acidobacteriota bacterium]
MRSIRTLPIRQKVNAVIMLTTACALVLACGAFIVYDSISLRRSEINDLEMLAAVVAAKSAAAVMFTDVEAATEILSSVRADPSIVAGAILTNDGRPFVTYGQWNVASRLKKTVKVFQPIRYQNDEVASLVLVSDLREVRSGVRMKIVTGTIVLIIALLVALLMTTRLQRLVTQPLVDLAGAARRVRHEKDFAVRVSEGTQSDGDELVAVQQAFNEMLAEIQARDEALQRHQLQLECEVQTRTAELSTAVERNQAILDSAGEGIFGLDPSGVATFINPSAAGILGAGVFELVGRNLHAQMHAAATPLAECRICSATLAPAVRTGRATLVRESDGVEVPIEYTSSTIIGSGGAASGVVVTFRDISERLAIERMKDEFVSTVSHELRTPLTAIRGALGLLGAGLLGTPAPKAQRMLEIALSNTERLGRLINDILDLEKMESGRVELNRKPVAATDMLRQAAEGLQAMGDRAGVRIQVHAAPAELLVDSDRILQMLINLISNAIKFSPSGTTVDVTGRLADDRYIVAVRDEGRGIPENKLEAIFERFKQVDASDSRDKGGTGLGLAICRSIAEAHGGKIWARRAESAGSIFTFTLPMPPSPASTPTRRVILYEEDERSVPAFATALEARGLSVVVAHSERELCEAAASHPEAILIDLHIASASKALLQALQSSNCLNVPIIITAAEEPAWIGDQAATIARWVPKPASGEVVAEAVLQACAGVDVLVIEDDFDLARVLIAALEEGGIRVEHAATGKDAIAALERHVPSLIVLDLVLPELDGFAVVKWMRGRASLAHIPLLVYSAREVSTAEQQQLTLGPTEFVTKSRVSIEEFEARVAHLLFAVTAADHREAADAA